MGLDFEKCLECIYSDEHGECKKGFIGFDGDCYFEGKYIRDWETDEIILSEEDELDEMSNLNC